MAFMLDPEKNTRNIEERGLSFDLVNNIEWSTALIVEDTRQKYGEVRLQVLALLGERLHAVVVSPRGEDLRVRSFRKANDREARRYAKGQ